MRLTIAALLSVCALSGCSSTTSYPVQWEYKTVRINPFENGLLGRKLEDINNEFIESQSKLLIQSGEQGWELVHVQDTLYIFKRPRKE